MKRALPSVDSSIYLARVGLLLLCPQASDAVEMGGVRGGCPCTD